MLKIVFAPLPKAVGLALECFSELDYVWVLKPQKPDRRNPIFGLCYKTYLLLNKQLYHFRKQARRICSSQLYDFNNDSTYIR